MNAYLKQKFCHRNLSIRRQLVGDSDGMIILRKFMIHGIAKLQNLVYFICKKTYRIFGTLSKPAAQTTGDGMTENTCGFETVTFSNRSKP